MKKKDSFIVGPSQTRHAHHKFENSKTKNKQTKKIIEEMVLFDVQPSQTFIQSAMAPQKLVNYKQFMLNLCPLPPPPAPPIRHFVSMLYIAL